ncbi:MAG: hypothetical protein ACLGSD_11035 [Acidobacteriota bacterium]
MRNLVKLAVVILGCALPAAAQMKALTPVDANIRFSEQISNGPAGNCGCFAMEGFAGGAAWTIHSYGVEHNRAFGAVADFSWERTHKVSNAPYGLTLTTAAFGPRFSTPAFKSTRIFAQSLFGFTHGSNSAFPVHNSLEPSANSFALVLGGGMDHPVSQHLSIRIFQLQYLRTALPNNTSNWQNNLQISTGLKFSLSR